MCACKCTWRHTRWHVTPRVSLTETVGQLCRIWVLTRWCFKHFLILSEVQHQLATTDTLYQTLTILCLSVSRLSLWNVYDSGAVDKLEIDLDWKANKIAKAQSQLKSSKREQGGGGEKESNRRKSINTGLALREHRVMSTSSTHTEYCAENADTPSRRAGWCLVLLSLIRETLLVERKLNCPNDANRKQQVHSSYLPARIGNVYVRLWVGWVCVRCQGKVLI